MENLWGLLKPAFVRVSEIKPPHPSPVAVNDKCAPAVPSEVIFLAEVIFFMSKILFLYQLAAKELCSLDNFFTVVLLW